MTVEEALELARRHGKSNVILDGDSLHLEADAPPPNGLLAILGRGKWDIVAALRPARGRRAPPGHSADRR